MAPMAPIFLTPSGKPSNIFNILVNNSTTGIANLINISPRGAILSFNFSIAAVILVAGESEITFNSFSATSFNSFADIDAISRTLEAWVPSFTMLLNSAPSLAY